MYQRQGFNQLVIASNKRHLTRLPLCASVVRWSKRVWHFIVPADWYTYLGDVFFCRYYFDGGIIQSPAWLKPDASPTPWRPGFFTVGVCEKKGKTEAPLTRPPGEAVLWEKLELCPSENEGARFGVEVCWAAWMCVVQKFYSCFGPCNRWIDEGFIHNFWDYEP